MQCMHNVVQSKWIFYSAASSDPKVEVPKMISSQSGKKCGHHILANKETHGLKISLTSCETKTAEENYIV